LLKKAVVVVVVPAVVFGNYTYRLAPENREIGLRAGSKSGMSELRASTGSSRRTPRYSTDADVVEEVGILNSLGLTQIQSRVYVHLLSAGERSARAVVDSLRIDRVDVYRALQNLQSFGLIEVNLGNPNRYAASHPATALKLLVGKKEEELESVKRRASRLNRLLSKQMGRGGNRGAWPPREFDSDQFYRLKRGYAVVDTILETEREARKEVRKVVNRIGMGYHMLFGVTEVERKLIDSGVRIRLITDQKTGSMRRYSKIAEVRYAGDLTNALRYIIVDDRLIMLSMAPNTTDERDSVVLQTNNTTLIQALSNFFDNSWKSFK
jgi:sugar-specific transcriptional regulator TrmB